METTTRELMKQKMLTQMTLNKKMSLKEICDKQHILRERLMELLQDDQLSINQAASAVCVVRSTLHSFLIDEKDASLNTLCKIQKYLLVRESAKCKELFDIKDN